MSGIAEQTRNKAYHEHPTKESQCARVRMYLLAIPSGLTIAELSRLMGLPKSTISGRINDLKPAVIEDPFGGIMTVPYRALKLGRKGIGIELNTQYWMDGVKYLKEVESHKAIPTLFDVLNIENSSEMSTVNW